MDDDHDMEAAFLFFTMALFLLANRRKRDATGARRRWWVHPINELRADEGAWTLVIKRFRNEFPDKHMSCLRVTKEVFDQILTVVRPAIEKQDTQLRPAIPPEQRLCVTLFYLSTGDSFRTIALFFRMGESTVRSIVYDTCRGIWDTMSAEHLKTPTTVERWTTIAKDFERQWNFPNCVGSIDGKHCPVQAPPNSGSEYFNYKKHFSIVLMAVSDANYKFTYVDVGAAGRWSDAGTFENCSLNTALSTTGLNLPADRILGMAAKDLVLL